jgi:hypothetical protein
VTEKVDGTMATLYCYQGRWYVSSWESPEGSEEFISAVTSDGQRYYYSRRPVRQSQSCDHARVSSCVFVCVLCVVSCVCRVCRVRFSG